MRTQRLGRARRQMAQRLRQRQQTANDIAAQQIQAVDHCREQAQPQPQLLPQRESGGRTAQEHKRCAQSVRPRHGSSSSV